MRMILICILAPFVLLAGCASKRTPLEVIVLPDVSASIDPESQKQMFTALKSMVLRLHRGDSLTIIPITGDAEASLQGQILRYELASSEKREAYDSDLQRLGVEVSDDLTRLDKEAAAHPGRHTDILGSVRVALSTFSTVPDDKRLIILSDFIQDDDQFKFDADRRLDTSTDSIRLATEMSAESAVPKTVKVIMGRLESSQFTKLPLNRRRAIDAFWGRVFGSSSIAPDGIFVLQSAF